MTKYLRHFWLAYPFLALKIFIFYWQTDRLDMMHVYEVPALTVLLLFGIFELCSMGRGKAGRWIFYVLYTIVTLLMFADAAYSSYFGKYISVNQIYQITSLGQIAGDGNVIGAAVSPGCLLTLIDYPFVLWFFRLRQKGGESIFSMRMRKFLPYMAAHTVLLIVMIVAASGVGFWFNNYVMPSPVLNFMLIGMAFSATFSNMVSEQRLEQIMGGFNPFLHSGRLS